MAKYKDKSTDAAAGDFVSTTLRDHGAKANRDLVCRVVCLDPAHPDNVVVSYITILPASEQTGAWGFVYTVDVAGVKTSYVAIPNITVLAAADCEFVKRP